MIETANTVVSRDNSTVIIKCTGAMDLTNSSELHDAIADACETMDSVTIDLSQVIFIDTAVLSYLAYGAKVMLSRGMKLNVIVKAKSQPLRVLETVGFNSLMNIEATVPTE